MFTLLRGGQVYTPKYVGEADVLIAGTQIASVAKDIDISSSSFVTRIVDITGKIVVPGFIDQHVHILGGGGSGGPTTRIPELYLSQITLSGITTVCSLLGLDTISKPLESLLLKARSLDEAGITSYIYAGGFDYPPPTLLGGLKRDLALVDKIIGVKIALGEELGSQISSLQLSQIMSETVAGAKLGKKPGLIHVHIGDCVGSDPFALISEALDITGIAPTHVVLTHLNWNMDILNRATKIANRGIILNLDSVFRPEFGAKNAVSVTQSIHHLLDKDVNFAAITMTTDGNAILPSNGYTTGLETLWLSVKEVSKDQAFGLEDALRLVTSNPARVLGLGGKKGSIVEGADADLQILTQDLDLLSVYSKGRLFVDEGVAVIKDQFENAEENGKTYKGDRE